MNDHVTLLFFHGTLSELLGMCLDVCGQLRMEKMSLVVKPQCFPEARREEILETLQ